MAQTFSHRNAYNFVNVKVAKLRRAAFVCLFDFILCVSVNNFSGLSGQFVCLFVLLLYVPSQQLWSLRDGQFT